MADPVSKEAAEVFARSAEQSIWRVVHQIAGRHGLDEGQIKALRLWVGERMRDHAYAAFEKGSRKPVMRATFADAIDHAARDLSNGVTPG